ncbi:hypothetical protein Q7C36_021340 [Tachysurus vachellii]|uniref:Uncharacterized protein n=1 Tax=Tachysurus vachellii TaxID=175792 RepID=A0AA88LNH1_TACVA|nr:hypothetical protein Q7C36_021340 [Tachysurus vachellii]
MESKVQAAGRSQAAMENRFHKVSFKLKLSGQVAATSLKKGCVYVTLQAPVRQIPGLIPSGWNLEECRWCKFRVSEVKDAPGRVCQGICLAGACSITALVKLQGASQMEPDT